MGAYTPQIIFYTDLKGGEVMNTKQMDRFICHCDKCFGKEVDCVIHPTDMNGLHIDVLLYSPTEKYPYWKMVTMGASDYKMPRCKNTIAGRNEYIMLVDKDVDMKDEDVAFWYCQKLSMIASYSYTNKIHVTYGHSFEWQSETETDEMIAAFLEFPPIFDCEILHYKPGLFTDIACLLVVLLNKNDLNLLMEIGPEQFSYYLFPEGADKPAHFLSERNRSDKF